MEYKIILVDGFVIEQKMSAGKKQSISASQILYYVKRRVVKSNWSNSVKNL